MIVNNKSGIKSLEERVKESYNLWTGFEWDEWIPGKVRQQIISFYKEGCSEGPQAWFDYSLNAPEHGCEYTDYKNNKEIKGRFVFTWNNMGRLILPDGSYKVISFSPRKKGIETISLDIWNKRGEELFGKDKSKWIFVCPSCGNKQSGESVKKHNKNVKNVSEWIMNNCESRYTKGYGKSDCKWTLGGLLQIHKLQVLANNHCIPVFEFAKEVEK